MIISEKLKQRFCKDNNISLQIFSDKIFEERLKLFGFLDKWNSFISFVSTTFKTEQDYFEYYNNLKDKMIDFIKNSEAFISLNTTDMSQYEKLSLSQSDVYKQNNIGKCFISIDIRKANFSALVHYSKETNTKFFDEYDYKEFIKMFTPYDCFADSKYVRQVVFGNCNPKRQVSYEKYLVSKLLKDLIDKDIIELSDVYSLCSDEIILIDNNLNLEALSKYFDNFTEFPLKLEYFKLGKLVGTDAYIKILPNDIELKCVNPYEAPFIYRFINKEKSTDTDTIFMFNGKPAKLLEVPEISLQTTIEENNNGK